MLRDHFQLSKFNEPPLLPEINIRIFELTYIITYSSINMKMVHFFFQLFSYLLYIDTNVLIVGTL